MRLAYTYTTDTWYLEVWRTEDGLAYIKRIRCRKGLKPAEWLCESSTPEHWVSVQSKRKLYQRVD